jgi:mono/diheme cytochrome c family protein
VNRLWIFVSLIGFVSMIGCGRPAPPQFRFNQVELLKQERLTLPPGEKYDSQYKEQIERVLLSWFGTPDVPRLAGLKMSVANQDETIRLPQDSVEDGAESAPGQPHRELFSPYNLEHAAGAVRSDEEGKSFGLYREHCANCHGLTGDGAGTAAGFLDPYPRDFRLGKYKFKSTPLRQAPTHQDLAAILVNGIPGTAMPSFRRLKAEEREAIIDYVRYLSVRGQTERYLIASLAQIGNEPILAEMDVQPHEELTDAELDKIANQSRQSIDIDVLAGFVSRWKEAESKVTVVPERPESLSSTHPGHQALVDRGRELYFKKGNCAECHGDIATGLSATIYYDDWTNDWIKSSGIDLTNKSSYRDFLKAGALPPRPVRPRNLKMAVMRGGDTDEDIYRKIANGIEGTPMPSSAATLTPVEIWELVAYVKSVAGSTVTNLTQAQPSTR